jgi:4-hydroxythreonine-4-phosphate dehydrogenase
MHSTIKPLIAITMGDPSGVGPEVIAKALMDGKVYKKCRPVVIGNRVLIEKALNLVGSPSKTEFVNKVDEVTGCNGVVSVLESGELNHNDITDGELSAVAGSASVEWIVKSR